jgi:hypothetical protein
LAAASLCQAYKSITRRLHPETPQECERKVEIFVRESLGINKGDSAETMQLCCKEIYFLQNRSLHSSLQAVRKKYQGPEFAAIHTYIFS